LDVSGEHNRAFKRSAAMVTDLGSCYSFVFCKKLNKIFMLLILESQ
jgi:hypothetical protein